MINVDEIECVVAIPDAIKVESLTCTTSLLQSSVGLSLFLQVLGVLGTFALAFLAWRAWRTAKADLKQTQEIAQEQRQERALASFQRELGRLVNLRMQKTPASEVSRAAFAATTQGTLWALPYGEIYSSAVLEQIVDQFQNMLFEASDQKVILRQELLGGSPARENSHGIEFDPGVEHEAFEFVGGRASGPRLDFITLQKRLLEHHAAVSRISREVTIGVLTPKAGKSKLDSVLQAMQDDVKGTWVYVATIEGET